MLHPSGAAKTSEHREINFEIGVKHNISSKNFFFLSLSQKFFFSLLFLLLWFHAELQFNVYSWNRIKKKEGRRVLVFHCFLTLRDYQVPKITLFYLNKSNKKGKTTKKVYLDYGGRGIQQVTLCESNDLIFVLKFHKNMQL